MLAGAPDEVKNPYRGHYCFNKAEVALHMTFIGAAIYMALF